MGPVSVTAAVVAVVLGGGAVLVSLGNDSPPAAAEASPSPSTPSARPESPEPQPSAEPRIWPAEPKAVARLAKRMGIVIDEAQAARMPPGHGRTVMSAAEAFRFAREFGAHAEEPSALLAVVTTTRQGHPAVPGDLMSDIVPLFDHRLSWILGWGARSTTTTGREVVVTQVIVVDARTGEVAGGYTS